MGVYDTEELSVYRNYLRQKAHQMMIWNLIRIQATTPITPIAVTKLPKAFELEYYPITHIKVTSIEFSAGPIGLTVIRGTKNLACVSHILPEGATTPLKRR